MSEDELKLNPVRKSLHIPILFMGGERELSLLSILFSCVLILFVQTLAAFITGILLWFLSIPLLRKMAKKDDKMSLVYRRSVNYQKYYPHSSTVYTIKDPKRTASIKSK